MDRGSPRDCNSGEPRQSPNPPGISPLRVDFTLCDGHPAAPERVESKRSSDKAYNRGGRFSSLCFSWLPSMVPNIAIGWIRPKLPGCRAQSRGQNVSTVEILPNTGREKRPMRRLREILRLLLNASRQSSHEAVRPCPLWTAFASPVPSWEVTRRACVHYGQCRWRRTPRGLPGPVHYGQTS